LAVAVRRILIVDSSLPVRTVLTDILMKLGQPPDTLIAVGSHEDALKEFHKSHPEMVFTEMAVNGKDSLHFIETMLNAEPRLKIVIVTAEDRTSPNVREAIRMGAFDYVEKPLRMEKIRAAFSAILVEEGGVERMR